MYTGRLGIKAAAVWVSSYLNIINLLLPNIPHQSPLHPHHTPLQAHHTPLQPHQPEPKNSTPPYRRSNMPSSSRARGASSPAATASPASGPSSASSAPRAGLARYSGAGIAPLQPPPIGGPTYRAAHARVAPAPQQPPPAPPATPSAPTAPPAPPPHATQGPASPHYNPPLQSVQHPEQLPRARRQLPATGHQPRQRCLKRQHRAPRRPRTLLRARHWPATHTPHYSRSNIPSSSLIAPLLTCPLQAV